MDNWIVVPNIPLEGKLSLDSQFINGYFVGR